MKDPGRRTETAHHRSTPDNPDRSFRMSMLAHGFVDDPESHQFKLDSDDRAAYSVVGLRGKITTADVVFAVLLVLVIVVAVIALASA